MDPLLDRVPHPVPYPLVGCEEGVVCGVWRPPSKVAHGRMRAHVNLRACSYVFICGLVGVGMCVGV